MASRRKQIEKKRGRSRKRQNNQSLNFIVLIFVAFILIFTALFCYKFISLYSEMKTSGGYSRSEVTSEETVMETETEFVTETEETTLETETETETESIESEREKRLNDLISQGYRQIETHDTDKISLTFAGDILFDDSYAVMSNLKQHCGGNPDLSYAFDDILMGYMRGADLFMLNNEFPYSSGGAAKEGKAFTFRARPEYAMLLHQIGVDLVSVANNHINDYGQTAMLDTFTALDNASIPYVGAGHNIEEASKPLLYTNGDVKIAIFSATQIERMGNPDTVGAGDNSPGVFRCFNIDRLLDQVKAAKSEGNVVIVYIHWGTESTENIDEWQLKQAKQLAEAGVDIIIGDHPHVLQRIDYVGEMPVIYSLGNYWFNSKTLETCLFTVSLDASDGHISTMQFIPAIQSGCRTKYAGGEEGQRIIDHMRQMSKSVDIDENGMITRK